MKIFYILFIILLTTLQSKSQTSRPVSQQDAVARVTKFYPNPAVSQITFDFDQNPDKSQCVRLSCDCHRSFIER